MALALPLHVGNTISFYSGHVSKIKTFKCFNRRALAWRSFLFLQIKGAQCILETKNLERACHYPFFEEKANRTWHLSEATLQCVTSTVVVTA